MGGSPILNVFIYTHNVGSTVTSKIGIQTSVGGSPKNLVKVYTPGGGSTIDNFLFYTPMDGSSVTFSKVLHT